jgi:peroxiredoxin
MPLVGTDRAGRAHAVDLPRDPRFSGVARAGMTRALDQDARLAQGLVGRELPAVTLTSYDERPVELAYVAIEGLVIYTYPGSVLSPDGGISSADGDTVQHRAFDRHDEDLRAHELQVVGLSSEAPSAQRKRAWAHGVGHMLWSDPGLLLAEALGMPTFTHDGVGCYRRLTIIAREARIVKAFFPVHSPERSAAQVIWWAQAMGR